jgi:hypothetical protein
MTDEEDTQEPETQEPHDVLAAEEFPMPAPQRGWAPVTRHGESPRQRAVIAGALLLLVLRRRRRARRRAA